MIPEDTHKAVLGQLALERESNRRLHELLQRQNERLQRSYRRNQVNERNLARLDRLLTEAGK